MMALELAMQSVVSGQCLEDFSLPLSLALVEMVVSF
jgi:hypothetical protein